MRPICVVATSVARLRIHGCARYATRPLHWGPRDEVGEGPLATESLGRPSSSASNLSECESES
jgi:hypothetical protein